MLSSYNFRKLKYIKIDRLTQGVNSGFSQRQDKILC